MNKHRREMVRATRTPVGALASLAAAAFAVAAGGCTVMIDQELSTKTGAGGASGSGAGGSDAGGGTGGAGSAGQSTTSLTMSSQTTTSQTVTASCPQGCELPHTIAVCQAGECVILDCKQGFDDCNEASFDGCEADLFHDDANCGKCHHACDTDEGDNCKEGKCK